MILFACNKSCWFLKLICSIPKISSLVSWIFKLIKETPAFPISPVTSAITPGSSGTSINKSKKAGIAPCLWTGNWSRLSFARLKKEKISDWFSVMIHSAICVISCCQSANRSNNICLLLNMTGSEEAILVISRKPPAASCLARGYS